MDGTRLKGRDENAKNPNQANVCAVHTTHPLSLPLTLAALPPPLSHT